MDVSMIPIFIMVSTMIELSSKFKNIIFWALTASIALIVFGIFVIDIFANDAQGKDKLSIIFFFSICFFRSSIFTGYTHNNQGFIFLKKMMIKENKKR
ncbi:hypothetical protein IC611_08825 [Proteus mirabilis]